MYFGGYTNSHFLKNPSYKSPMKSTLVYGRDFNKLCVFVTSLPKKFPIGNCCFKNHPDDIINSHCSFFLVLLHFTQRFPITDSYSRFFQVIF